MITTKEMHDLEDLAEAQGISTLQLMERAGKGVAAAAQMFDLPEDTRVIVFCGSGNNGGDGLVAARYLSLQFPVVVLLFGEKKKLTEEAQRNYERLKNPITIVEIHSPQDLGAFHVQQRLPLLLIDALLGTEIKGELREPLAAGIDLFNRLKGRKIAVDVPSGINPDTGEITGKACQVDVIVTFHDVKVGLAALQHKTLVVDIGIPH